ncbi:MAG: serine hydrolase [Marinilabilia sp.]
MIEKKLPYIFFFLVYILATGQSYAVTIGNEQTNDSVMPGTVDQMTLEEKVALLLMPVRGNNEKTALDKFSFRGIEPFFGKDLIFDGNSGFVTPGIPVPFPDAITIKRIQDRDLKERLKADLFYQASINGYSGVFATADYLFQPEEPAGISTNERRKDHKFALWIFTNDERGVDNIPVYDLPGQIFSPSRSLSYSGNNGSEEVFDRDWVLSEKPSYSRSFEELVDQGIVFRTEQYERDHSRLVRAYRNNMLIEEELDQGCRNILEVLEKKRKFPFPVEKVDPGYSEFVRRKAFESSLRLFVRDQGPLLPSDLSSLNIEIVSDTDADKSSVFEDMVQNHITTETYDSSEVDYVFWLAGYEEMNDSSLKQRIDRFEENFPGARVVLFMGNPGNYFYTHALPPGIHGLLAGASDWPVVWEMLAQAAFSGLEVEQAEATEQWNPSLKGLSVKREQNRIKFGVPEEAGMNRDSLARIDELVNEAIKEKATPGAQVMVIRKGTVVWHKAYGHHTYEGNKPVTNNDLYDVASVTKVAATLPSLMKLYDERRWSPDDSLSHYFPQADTTDKGSIRLKELLLHESGLPSFIPFYLNTVDKDEFKGSLFSRRYSWQYNIKIDDYTYLNRNVTYRDDVFSHENDSVFSVPVAGDHFMNTGYIDSIKAEILTAPIRSRHKYLYSDLGFYFLGELVPRLTGISLNDFSERYFFRPIGARRTTFLPLQHFDKEHIVPTEDDKAFRKQLLHGWVHDPGAAMLGGVAGHAGLFSNSTDMGRIMQMLLNKGRYGGKQFLREETVDLFTRQQNGVNRRALGFDKPEPDTLKVSPASKYASQASYGHSGFTGTLVWVDPMYDLVFIFLSNRIHPHQYNKTLIKENYRTRIQDVVYRSFFRIPVPGAGFEM